MVAFHQRMEHKLTDQLPELGFSKIQTLHGREIGESEVLMLDVPSRNDAIGEKERFSVLIHGTTKFYHRIANAG